MPNVASTLKAEIARLARKELRSATEPSQKAIASYRHQIADLKRRLKSLEGQVSRLRKQSIKPSPMQREDEQGSGLRFRADGFASHRQRLGLSAKEMGFLLGASALSVYKWEKGQAKPRSKHLVAIAALRKMGKREARQRLSQFSGS